MSIIKGSYYFDYNLIYIPLLIESLSEKYILPHSCVHYPGLLSYVCNLLVLVHSKGSSLFLSLRFQAFKSLT